MPSRWLEAPGATIGAPALCVDAVRESWGEADGDAEPRRANRAARSSVGFLGVVDVIDALCVVSRLMEDFLSALRRARRSSSEPGIAGYGVKQYEEIRSYMCI